MKSPKIGSFISTIITLLISVVLSYLSYVYLKELPTDGLESLTLIITIPVALLLGISLIGLLISSLITSLSGLRSSVIAIRILSIFFLILTLADIGYVVFKILSIAKII